MDVDDAAPVGDVRRERRIVIVVIMVVLVVAAVLTVLVRRTPAVQAAQWSLPVTAWAKVSETRLLVQYQLAAGSGPVTVVADESGAPVVVRVLKAASTPAPGDPQQAVVGLAPLDLVVAEVDLAAPLGDRAVVGDEGHRLPERSPEELRG